MSTREIVTLQIGHYANFVGTHWWNIQESSFVYTPQALTGPKEINHDVLFREGQTLHGEVTYTPRLIAVDLKGSLKALRREGTLYEAGQEEDVKWESDVTLHESSPVEKNEFLEDLDRVEAEQMSDVPRNLEDKLEDPDKKPKLEKPETEDAVFGRKLYDLDDTVSVWSDFLRVHLHPKSLHIVDDFIHKNEEQPFDMFQLGAGVLKNVDAMDAMEDQIRFFVEECDHLQGFHLLMDWCDGFGGYGAGLLQYLEDEFTNKARMTCAVSPAIMPDSTVRQRANRIINSAFCLDKGGNLSSLFIPMSLTDSLWRKMGPPRDLPHLSYKGQLDYHTSGILAACLDTLSLPYRQDGYSTTLADITGSFNNLGRKVSAVYSSLPFPLTPQGTFVESLMSHKDQAPWYSLTPHVGTCPHPYMQSCVVRGVPAHRITRSEPTPNIPGILTGCSSLSEILHLYLSETYPRTLNAGCTMRDACKVVSPFPHVFSSKVSNNGYICDTDRPSYQGVESVPVMTSLQSNDSVYNLTSSLLSEAARFNIRKHHHYLEAGLEEDEYQETLDNVSSLGQCYQTDTSAT
ncbi:protein misato homolog 1-like [Haliotis cracherodii]|uniref:protein misato homolog 1-like n=1 Tax=Haliotis cracherodii TaxID=6455 RepID=UPI0039EB0CE9